MELLLASDFRGTLQDILVISLCVIAVIWGAKPERAAIAIWVLCFELPTLIYNDFFSSNVELEAVNYYLAAKDISAGALWILLALYANRSYTLWIAGAQLLAIGSHVARGLVEAISPIAYIFLVVAPGWMVLLIMALGFAFHIRRKKKYGPYRDWRIVNRPPDLPTLKPGKVA